VEGTHDSQEGLVAGEVLQRKLMACFDLGPGFWGVVNAEVLRCSAVDAPGLPASRCAAEAIPGCVVASNAG
jgi:hypothetical protein